MIKLYLLKTVLVYFEGLVRNNIQAEMHIFQKGGHGYGLAINRGTESAWPELCLSWLKENLK